MSSALGRGRKATTPPSPISLEERKAPQNANLILDANAESPAASPALPAAQKPMPRRRGIRRRQQKKPERKRDPLNMFEGAKEDEDEMDVDNSDAKTIRAGQLPAPLLPTASEPFGNLDGEDGGAGAAGDLRFGVDRADSSPAAVRGAEEDDVLGSLRAADIPAPVASSGRPRVRASQLGRYDTLRSISPDRDDRRGHASRHNRTDSIKDRAAAAAEDTEDRRRGSIDEEMALGFFNTGRQRGSSLGRDSAGEAGAAAEEGGAARQRILNPTAAGNAHRRSESQDSDSWLPGQQGSFGSPPSPAPAHGRGDDRRESVLTTSSNVEVIPTITPPRVPDRPLPADESDHDDLVPNPPPYGDLPSPPQNPGRRSVFGNSTINWIASKVTTPSAAAAAAPPAAAGDDPRRRSSTASFWTRADPNRSERGFTAFVSDSRGDSRPPVPPRAALEALDQTSVRVSDITDTENEAQPQAPVVSSSANSSAAAANSDAVLRSRRRRKNHETQAPIGSAGAYSSDAESEGRPRLLSAAAAERTLTSRRSSAERVVTAGDFFAQDGALSGRETDASRESDIFDEDGGTEDAAASAYTPPPRPRHTAMQIGANGDPSPGQSSLSSPTHMGAYRAQVTRTGRGRSREARRGQGLSYGFPIGSASSKVDEKIHRIRAAREGRVTKSAQEMLLHKERLDGMSHEERQRLEEDDLRSRSQSSLARARSSTPRGGSSRRGGTWDDDEDDESDVVSASGIALSRTSSRRERRQDGLERATQRSTWSESQDSEASNSDFISRWMNSLAYERDREERLLDGVDDPDQQRYVSVRHLHRAKDILNAASKQQVKTAIRRYRQDIDQTGRTYGHDHPGVASQLHDLGVLLQRLGKWREAKHAFEQTLIFRKQHLPTNHPRIGDSYFNLGVILKANSDFTHAAAYFCQASAVYIEAYGPHNEEVRDALHHMADCRDLAIKRSWFSWLRTE